MSAAPPTPTPDAALEAVFRFCADRDWLGWDPYDGLMGTAWPIRLLNRSRIGRLYLIQGIKRSPLNLRPLLGIPPLRNAKALALGLEACCALAGLDRWRERAEVEAMRLAGWLLEGFTPTPHGLGWGYPFDWQSRAFFLPRGTPTIVCTGFVVRALDRARLAFPQSLDRRAIEAALAGAADFVRHDLNRLEDENGFCWSYSPLDRSRVVNATLLGAETIARAVRAQDRPAALAEIEGTVRWSLAQQRTDGGWSYGKAAYQQWEDGFHTGFNLLSMRALREVARDLGRDPESAVPLEPMERAYRYYTEHFFDPDGRPWYYRHTPWPIDSHAAAVAILTHAAFAADDPAALDRARRTLEWSLVHLWNERGYFDFTIRPRYRIRIPYLRWCQAWMLRALAEHERAGGSRFARPAPTG